MKKRFRLKKQNFIVAVVLALTLGLYFLENPLQGDKQTEPLEQAERFQTHSQAVSVSQENQTSDTLAFRNTPPRNFGQAKKIARQLFSEHRITFYCDCPFDKHGNVDINSCGYLIQKDKRRAKRLEWEHIVPVSLIANHLPCWRGQGCCEYGQQECVKGRRCCQKVDPRFQAMEADLHNLVPELGELNALRSNYRFGVLPHVPAGQLGECRFKIDPDLRRVEPQSSKRGVIARAHLYMASTYGFRLSDSQRQLFQAWNRQHPPDLWERDWDNKIAQIQTNHNSYISDYDRMK